MASDFQKKSDLLDLTLASGNRANRRRRLNRFALGALYESALLSLTKSLETFLEEYFLLLLHSPAARVEVGGYAAIVTLSNREAVDQMFGLEENYLDWLPFGRTVARAEQFFPSGSPFHRLERASQEKRLLKVNYAMRNAVAHNSGTAVKKFLDLPEVMSLPVRTRSVAEYLRWRDPVTRAETWADHRVAIGAIVKALAASSEADARAFMGTEDPFKSGDSPGSGAYRCHSCSKLVTLPYPGSRLRPCTGCHRTTSYYRRVW
ncbi:hypothetical protein H4N58_11795 [Mumia sp. ZJ1417]|uniref:hypothetical protein n=1 Tax=Mumia sp. ZJ1417 TaxID=2708082 RepID=UPI00141DDA77|nr:hypothetical protein [Mumia sp. ZJ1417]QMW64917.1 hypothetical protein H4N58_11795 [Mumia sp. ZJ1417]